MSSTQDLTITQVTCRIIRMPELTRLIGLSRSTIYDRLNPESKRFDPTFPPPLKLGRSAVGWHLGAVLEWIDALQRVTVSTASKE
ncbi:AlpA family phage regulatory protein [Aeromonas veronii]|nr:AlpA family phage regulatory protein [Aeromonas veronii]ATY82053.1 AlpA family phage regulatory protein [Aeromonas veronii]HEA3202609.1 AlpA family phage regulatory protein [Aeromonas veronii]